MNDSSTARKRVAGYNQFAKLVRKGKAAKVYLASDADFYFVNGVKRELEGHKEIKLDTSKTALQLAEMCSVEVPTAVVTEVEA